MPLLSPHSEWSKCTEQASWWLHLLELLHLGTAPSPHMPAAAAGSLRSLLNTFEPSRGHGCRSVSFCTWDQREHGVGQWTLHEEYLGAVGCRVFFHMDSATLEGERRVEPRLREKQRRKGTRETLAVMLRLSHS